MGLSSRSRRQRDRAGEVFADALSDRASAIIAAHNHPSGGLEPSPSDLEITSQLKAAGAARVGVLCHPGLVELFAGLRGADEAIGHDTPLPAGFDYWAPALSLPFHLRTTVDTVPAALPSPFRSPP